MYIHIGGGMLLYKSFMILATAGVVLLMMYSAAYVAQLMKNEKGFDKFLSVFFILWCVASAIALIALCLIMVRA